MSRAVKGCRRSLSIATRREGGIDFPRSGRSVWSCEATCCAFPRFAVQLLTHKRMSALFALSERYEAGADSLPYFLPCSRCGPGGVTSVPSSSQPRRSTCRRSLEQRSRHTHVNIMGTHKADWSMSTHTPIPRNAFDAMSAIARFRHQKRSGRSWLVGDRRIASSTIAKLEARRLVREVALRGTPTLVLTDQAKAILSGVGP